MLNKLPKEYPLWPIGGVTSAQNVTVSCQNLIFRGEQSSQSEIQAISGVRWQFNSLTTFVGGAYFSNTTHVGATTLAIFRNCTFLVIIIIINYRVTKSLPDYSSHSFCATHSSHMSKKPASSGIVCLYFAKRYVIYHNCQTISRYFFLMLWSLRLIQWCG